MVVKWIHMNFQFAPVSKHDNIVITVIIQA